MSLYTLQKCLFELNRDETNQELYSKELSTFLDKYDLASEERSALEQSDIGLLYVLGVNGQILMHYAAFLGIQWFDYLDLMREGVKKYGPVRAGVYAMVGNGRNFVTKGSRQ